MVRTLRSSAERQTFAVAGGQQFGLAVPAVAIDRPDGVKDILRGEAAGTGRHGVSGGAPADLAPDLIEFAHDRRTAGAVDGAVHSAAARQRRVGRVDDRVHRHAGDIAFLNQDRASRGYREFHGHRLQS